MPSHVVVLLSLLVAPLALSCKKGDDDSKSKGIDVDEVKAKMKSDVLPKVTAKVPKNLGKKLEFEVGTSADDRVIAAVPKGWKLGVIKAFAPDEDSFGTQMWISSNCDGMCQAKDWEKVAQKVDFDGMKTSTSEQVLDEKLPDGRIAIVKDKSGSGTEQVRIVMVRWKKDASRYFACRVSLEGAWVPAQDAFVEACKGMEIVRWGN
ncbi:MAG: hypothetical protein ABI175_27320 [Polyangiales bacterium]